MKSLQIKIWPEISGFESIILPWQNVEQKKHNISLDFSNCTKVFSSSLTPLLIRILKLIEDNPERIWESHNTIISETFDKIINLNFFHILNLYFSNQGLFWNQDFALAHSKVLCATDQFGNTIHSFPIHLIDLNRYSIRRDALKEFRNWLNQQLEPFFEKYDFNLSQLKLILNEIVKNTADHTNSNGFIGIDLIISADGSILEIRFSIGDQGIGINMHVKENLRPEQLKRYKFWDLTQTYRAALSNGFTTKMKSINNRGIGMSIILNGASELGLELSVFDADSRGLLSHIKSLTHSDIRKNFYNVGKSVGFHYTGVLIAKKVQL